MKFFTVVLSLAWTTRSGFLRSGVKRGKVLFISTLDRRQVFQHCPRGKSGGQSLQPLFPRDGEGVGEAGQTFTAHA